MSYRIWKRYRILFWLFLFLWVNPIRARAPRYLYFDFDGGSDANNCTSKLLACKSYPDNNKCAATGNNGGCAYTPAALDYYISKEGVHWVADHTANGVMPFAFKHSGSAGANIVFDTDDTWTATFPGDKAYWDGDYYPAFVFELDTGYHHITLRNLDINGALAPDEDTGAVFQAFGGVHDLLFQHVHIHGWRLTGSGPRHDGTHGGITINPNDRAAECPTLVMEDSEIENSENTGVNTQTGQAAKYWGVFRRTLIHDVVSAVVFYVDFDGGAMYNVSYPSGNFSPEDRPDGTGFHLNGLFDNSEGFGPYLTRNSTLHDVESGANIIYPNTAGTGGLGHYAYNNIIYGHMPASQCAITIDTFAFGDTEGGAFYGYSNLIDMTTQGTNCTDYAIRLDANSGSGGTARPKLTTLELRNNMVIRPDGSSLVLTNANQSQVVNTIVQDHNLMLDATTAASQGFAFASLYAPQNCTNSAYRAGADISGVFTTTFTGSTRTGTWDIGPYQKTVCASVGTFPNHGRMHR